MTDTTADRFSYPNMPGSKTGGTSRAAAEAIAPRAPTLRQRVLDVLGTASLTADEVAAVMRKSVLSVRPRLSELLALELIEDTGKTRPNASGIKATVWKVKEDV